MVYCLDKDLCDNSSKYVTEIIQDPFEIDHVIIALAYPKEIKDENIFHHFVESLAYRMNQLVYEAEQTDDAECLFNHARFDTQKIKYKTISEDHKNNFYKILNEMNSEISPYTVILSKNVKENLYGYHIESDYLVDIVNYQYK